MGILESENSGIVPMWDAYYETCNKIEVLTQFDMGFCTIIYGGGGGGMRAPHHNFVVIAQMIMKFGTGVKLDVFYKKICDVTTITSL